MRSAAGDRAAKKRPSDACRSLLLPRRWLLVPCLCAVARSTLTPHASNVRITADVSDPPMLFIDGIACVAVTARCRTACARCATQSQAAVFDWTRSLDRKLHLTLDLHSGFVPFETRESLCSLRRAHQCVRLFSTLQQSGLLHRFSARDLPRRGEAAPVDRCLVRSSEQLSRQPFDACPSPRLDNMAMYQNAQRVNVEFLKSSTMKGRIIKLNYTPAQVPAQLYGRVDLARPCRPLQLNLATPACTLPMHQHTVGFVKLPDEHLVSAEAVGGVHAGHPGRCHAAPVRSARHLLHFPSGQTGLSWSRCSAACRHVAFGIAGCLHDRNAYDCPYRRPLFKH